MNFGTNLSISQYWFDKMWNSKMARGGGNNKEIQYCTDSSGQEIRALQGHSGRNPIDLELQDKVLIRVYLSYWMCSLSNSRLIWRRQNLSNR